MDNQTIMQYFEWYLSDNGLLWKKMATNAQELKNTGIDTLWLPPAYKGMKRNDVGYGVYDLYDLGEFDQKGTIKTKYGSKEEYLNRVIAFLEHLSPDIVVERLFSRIPKEDADFSNWGTSWWKLHDELMQKMEADNSFQGKQYNYLNGRALDLL